MHHLKHWVIKWQAVDGKNSTAVVAFYHHRGKGEIEHPSYPIICNLQNVTIALWHSSQYL